MSSLFDYLSKSSKDKLNTRTEAELKAERDAGPGRKISVWGQNKSTGHAARQNAGRPGEQGRQPRASAAPNKVHNTPNHRKSERKLCAKPTNRDVRRTEFIPGKIREASETSKSKQLGSTPPPQVVPSIQKPQERNDSQGSISLGTQQPPSERSRIATPKNATRGYDAPPGFDRRSWTIANGIGNGHAWGMNGGSKSGGLRYSQPQSMKQSDMEHDMYVEEAYGGVDYICSKK